MDIVFTAPDANGLNIALIYTYFNSGSQVDLSFKLFVPSTGNTFDDMEASLDAHEATYTAAHSYTVTNRIKWYQTPATGSKAGSMSAADFTKLAGLSAPAALSFTNNASHTIQTVAAAGNGFQLSATRAAMANYSVTVATTVQIGIGTNVSGYVVLEIAATNSSNAGDWVEIGRTGNSQNIGLAIALSSAQTTPQQLGGMVPAGYYARLRSVNVAGTPTYTYNSGQEVLL